MKVFVRFVVRVVCYGCGVFGFGGIGVGCGVVGVSVVVIAFWRPGGVAIHFVLGL